MNHKKAKNGNQETNEKNAHSLNHEQYLKKYKGDIVYSSEDDCDFEKEGKEIKERKYSNQLKECSEYSSKDELLTDKPAMNTLKKTFSSMLSRIPTFSRQRADSSSISDNCSVLSRNSKPWDAASTIDRALYGSRKERKSNNLGRANSSASVNIKSSSNFSYLDFLF